MTSHRLFSKLNMIGLFIAVCFSLFAQTARADGFIIVPPQPRPDPLPIIHIPYHFAPLSVKYHRVDVVIDGQKATTSIDQEFFNPNNRRLEGTYIFPVPEGAHFDSFSMDVNGKMLEAELLDADKARKIYEDIVRQAKDPALLEYVGRSAFKVRIYPIEPRSTKRVKISYTQILKRDSGMMEYVYPLNTEKFSSTLLDEVSIKVDIRSDSNGGGLKNIYSPTHPVEIRRHGENRAVIGFEQRNVRPDEDFKLVFTESSKQLGMDLITHRPDPNQPGYFMLMLSPGEADKGADNRILPKDLTFVLDSSGSMAGEKIVQARKALVFCLDNLNKDDRFEIVRFSTEAEPFFRKLTPVQEDTLAAARQFIRKIKPIGGTAIHEALEDALKLQAGDSTRPKMIMFITDGLPTIGETDEESIVGLVDNHRGNKYKIFSFGLGHDVNTHLLDRIAEKSRGVSRYVAPEEDLEIKLSNFFRKISEPVMTDLNLEVEGRTIRLTKMQPSGMPDLFNGDQLVLFGRFDGAGAGQLLLKGNMGEQQVVIDRSIQFPKRISGNRYIAEMWATRRVGRLLDQIRLNGESAELKQEISLLAREFGIVTPYTAYLIMEDEQIRNVPVLQRNYREMEQDHTVFSQVKQSYQSIVDEAGDEGLRSGKVAVKNARGLQQLKEEKYAMRSWSKKDVALAKSKVVAAPSMRQSKNYGQQVRVVKGRAFYQNGSVWNDSTAQDQTGLKTVKIVFNSKGYFEFMSQHKAIPAWLSLGRNVDIVLDDILYQVRES